MVEKKYFSVDSDGLDTSDILDIHRYFHIYHTNLNKNVKYYEL